MVPLTRLELVRYRSEGFLVTDIGTAPIPMILIISQVPCVCQFHHSGIYKAKLKFI